MKHEKWTCDRCEKDLPGEPMTFVAFAGMSPLGDEANRGLWALAHVHLCQACMDQAVAFLVGPSLRKFLETPRRLGPHSTYEPETPWGVKVGVKER